MATYIEPTIVNAVADQIDSAWTLVTTAFDRGISALDTLASQRFDIAWESVEVESLEAPAVIMNYPDIPELEEVPEISAEFSGRDIIVDSVSISSPVIPTFVDTAYEFSIPGAPEVSWPSFAKEAPSATGISLPSSPSFSIPEVPALASVTIPAPPEYSVPAFAGEFPVEDLTAPVVSFSWAESVYSSDLKTKLGDVIYDSLVAGGTGLNEATEQAIYSRAKSRMEDEEQSFLDSINDGMAAKGFPLPPGAYASAVLSAENKILRGRVDLNNDILVQQSKLAQENTHFIIQEAGKLETVLLSFHGEVQNRAMQAAQFVVTAAIQQYGLKVDAYKAKLTAYSTLAQVYQTRIQGEVAKAEFYRAQIDGVKASVAVQQGLIEAYRAQVSGIAALVDVYKAQMEGANIQAGIDRTRMEGFLAEVQAYSARVAAETAKYEGYKAQIAGESAKIDMRKANAETYLAQVSGVKVKGDIQVATQEAKLAKTQADIAVFNGYIQKYLADVQASVAVADITAKRNGLNIELYKTQGDAYTSAVNAAVQSYLGKVEEVKNKTTLSIKESEIAMQTLVNKYQLTAENLRSVAQVTGQMAASAASSVNASLSASHSDSNSASNQASFNRSESESNSTSYSVVEETIHQYSN